MLRLYLLFSISGSLLHVAFFTLDTTFHFIHYFIHVGGRFLRQRLIEMPNLQVAQEGSQEHLLIHMGKLFYFFIESCHIFAEGFRRPPTDVEQTGGGHISMFAGGKVIYEM